MLQINEMTTIVIWVMKEDAPNFKADENSLQSGIKLLSVSLNVLVRKKYSKEITNDTTCPIAVAQAAPDMPHLHPKMNTGSK